MSSRKTEIESDSPRRSAYDAGPWNEIVGVILIGAGLVILMALVSYSSDDPSWNSTGAYSKARNWIGPVGAQIADGLYQFFGLAALVLPITLFMAGWWQWQDDRPQVPKPKVLGVFFILVAITGFLTMIGSETPKAYYLGGLIGRWLLYAPRIGLSHLLGMMGSIIALLVLFIAGLVIGTEFSIVRNVVRRNDFEQEPGMLSRFNERYRNWRQERNAIRGQKETAEQLREKLRQRHRVLPPQKPVISQRGARSLSPAGGSSSTRAIPPPAAQADGFEDQSEDAYEIQPPPPTRAVSSPARIAPAAASNAVAQKPAASSPANGLSKRPAVARKPPKPEPPAPELEDYYADGDLPLDDPGDVQSSAKRSVEDMMATASVKRPEITDEQEAATRIQKLKTAIARMTVDYKLPSTEMLTPPAPRSEMEEAELLERARQLAEKCSEFNVSGQVKQISPGPVVTTFEFKPDPGVKYSRVTSLVDDLCLALKAESIRIDRIPGKSTVGIEVPNTHREIIRLREVIESKKYRESESKLTIALGKTIDGNNYVADLARMPHLLIAGATGAGKSVMLNGILISLLYKASPDEVKMILVDPKRLELGLYADIPHLLTPIVTDPKRAGYALKWAVSEMENRYKHLAAYGVRNIDQYNSEVCSTSNRNASEDNPDSPSPLPYIVVIIDELADLMMIAAREVEESITRLAQMARAVGIHLVLATQRPSVDVITGLIKANFPSRISFRVSSKVDSRTIIDTNGAEALLGSGDMLFLPPGTSRLVRVHGAYVDEKEVKRISDFVRSQGKPAYDEKVVMSDKETEGSEAGDFAKDEKYDDAVRIVIQSGKASTSLLQRHLRIGYGRAASMIDMMHREGIVGPEDGSKPRQVLVKADFLERLDQMREE
jgi:S-DNA-T family DNA segregation ATPase FtsK/SpoIIIE